MKKTKRTKTESYQHAETIKTPVMPTPEAIRLRAHQIYIERGCVPGRELEDWLLAEHELKQLARNNGDLSE